MLADGGVLLGVERGVLLGVVLGVLLGVLLGGRLVCSCATRERLNARVIMAAAKNRFILDIPSGQCF